MAAADGLVLIESSGIKVITDQFFTRREWAKLNPSTMLCAVWDECIFMFYDNGTTKGGYVLSGDGLTTTAIYATAAYTDPVTGSLFLCVDDKIVKFDAGATGQFKWHSKRNMIQWPQNLGVCQVLADAYPVIAKVYADGNLTDTKTVLSDDPFRLSSGFRARSLEIELTGSARVSMAALADEMGELLNV